MASGAIRYVDWALESTYGGRSTNTGQLGGASLTWYSTRFVDATQAVPFGDAVMEPETVNWGPGWAKRPAVAERFESRSWLRAKGQFTIDFLLMGGLGTMGQTNSAVGLINILSTRLTSQQTSVRRYDANVSASGSPTWSSSASIADLICYQDRNEPNRLVYGAAVSAGRTPTVAPQCAQTAGTTTLLGRGGTSICYQRLYHQRALYGDVPVGTVTQTTRRVSVAIRLVGEGWHQVCHGCVLRSLRIYPDGEMGAVRLSCVIDVLAIEHWYDSPTHISPFGLTGRPLFARGARAVLQPHGQLSFDHAVEFAPVNWSVSLDWTLTETAIGGYDTPAAPPEATACQMIADIDYVYDSRLFTALQSAMDNGTGFDLTLPFGGDLYGGPYPYGGSIVLVDWVLRSGAYEVPDLSSGQLRFRLPLQASADTDSVETPSFMLGYM